jgi:hypothetical protein
LRRSASGIAEKTLVSIFSGGVSRYIIFLFALDDDGRSINDIIRGVDPARLSNLQPAFRFVTEGFRTACGDGFD